MPEAIHADYLDIYASYRTHHKGVDYVALDLVDRWRVTSTSAAPRYFRDVTEVAAKCAAFAGLDVLVQPFCHHA